MQELLVTEAWRTAYPGASIGVLAMRGVANPTGHALLDKRKGELEQELCSRYSGYDRTALKALAAIQAYTSYYRQFRKTYHVLLQLESVVLKGRPILGSPALVEAMFMAELKHLLLTSGHDLQKVQLPIQVGVSDGGERFVRINGKEQLLKKGDMFIADAQGILSSVIYGPDQRTQIMPDTRQVLFTSYVPASIGKESVHEHLRYIRDSVLLVSPEAQVLSLDVYR